MRDDFFWLNKINRATVVVGLRNGQFDASLARRAARGIADVEAAGLADPAKRVKKYIAWEPMFIAAAGPEVTVIHAGRSSQDILSTVRTSMVRDDLLTFAQGLEGVIADLLKLARTHR
ncbi:MAG: argininosuccinate lyase, partial [Duodenibacillus sp.]